LAEKLRDLFKNKQTRDQNHAFVQERRKSYEFDWDAKVVEILVSGARA
jgi:hypothetical protein